MEIIEKRYNTSMCIKTAHQIYQMECAECSKTEALPDDPASTYKTITKAIYLLNLSSVMFNSSVVDHNGSPSLPYHKGSTVQMELFGRPN